MDPNSTSQTPVESQLPIDSEIKELSQSTEIDPATIPTHSRIGKIIIWGIIVILLMVSSGSLGYLVGVNRTQMQFISK